MSNDTVAMAETPTKTLVDVARELPRYSVDAFEFIREGLDYTVQRKHGPAVESLRKLLEWLGDNDLTPSDLRNRFEDQDLPKNILDIIEKLDGIDSAIKRLNLHVDGSELCWGLKSLAQERWGLMAPAVLDHWGIKSTTDFGRMVFALVDNGLLQKQPHDSIKDFERVFDFQEAFDRAYNIQLQTSHPPRKE